MAPFSTALFLFLFFLSFPLKTNKLFGYGILFFLLSSIFRAFAASFKIAALFETGMYCVAFAMTAAGSFRIRFSHLRARSELWLSITIFVFVAVTLTHNIIDLGAVQIAQLPVGVNPWGVTLIAMLAYFYLRKDSAKFGNNLDNPLVKKSTLYCSLGIFTIQVLIVLGLVQGNTAKVALQQGGYGLAGYSTNDTAFLANALLIAQYYYFFSETRGNAIFFVASLACLVCVALSESRTGAICAGVTSATYLYSYKGRNVNVKKLFFFIVCLVIGIVAAQVIIERTLSDAISSEAISSLGYFGNSGVTVTASGRAIIWEEYISAYLRLAERSWLATIFGVGPMSMAELYRGTSLDIFKLETIDGGYLPVHSDLIWLWIACGLIGVMFIVVFTFWAIKRRSDGPAFPPGRAAMWMLLIVSLADMFQYSMPAMALLWATIFSRTASSPPAASDYMSPR